ncbi:MAG: M48 family metalloprotease [Gammaproteobacteria bacterium]|nr:MAG: M48 family metalloprotease [Gammaproteobacteria bacterium]
MNNSQTWPFRANLSLQRIGHLVLTLALTFGPNISIAEINLPDIGGPASEGLSVSKEIELGQILISEVRGNLPVINDPELSQYIHSLGTRITSAGLNSNFPFTFVLIQNSDVNAFALPGGIVAINSGLLTLGEKESEVASVFAHEIAHVTQRHIARNFANTKSFGVISALTLLGSILAVAYGGGELGQAALLTTQSTLQERQLAYTRSFEQEADRIGMQLLVDANIDPQGMPAFFENLNKHTQLNRGQIPEFLSSHPLTTNRISESKSRANQYKGSFTSNTIHFEYAKARTIAITSNPNQLADYYKKKNRIPGSLSETETYAYALALSRTGKNQKALQQLKSISVNVDNELTIKLANAQILIVDGQYTKAENSLRKLEEIYPSNLSVIYYLATSLTESGNAHLALQKLDQLYISQPENPAFDKLKAKAASKANLAWRSHESLSDYYAAHGQYGTAMEQIQLSLRVPGIDSSSKARIETKKEQYREARKRRDNFK